MIFLVIVINLQIGKIHENYIPLLPYGSPSLRYIPLAPFTNTD